MIQTSTLNPKPQTLNPEARRAKVRPDPMHACVHACLHACIPMRWGSMQEMHASPCTVHGVGPRAVTEKRERRERKKRILRDTSRELERVDFVQTSNLKPQTPSPQPSTLYPNAQVRPGLPAIVPAPILAQEGNPKPCTLNPEP